MHWGRYGPTAGQHSEPISPRHVSCYALTNRHYEVAFPEVIIESAKFTPGSMSRLLRRLARASSKLAAKMRPDLLALRYEMGIRGRCVAIRKTAEDNRDSQSRFHIPFPPKGVSQ